MTLRVLIIGVVLGLVPGIAWADVVYVTKTEFAEDSTSATVTFSTQNNRLAVMAVRMGATTTLPTVTSASCGGVALSFVRADEYTAPDEKMRVEAWRLLNPGSGAQTCSAVLSSSPNQGLVITVYELAEVDQTTPIEAHTGTNGCCAGGTFNNITTLTDHALVLDLVAASANQTPSAGSGQTERENRIMGPVLDFAAVSTKLVLTAGSATTSWSAGEAGNWVLLQLAIRPAGGVTPPPVSIVNLITKTEWPEGQLSGTLTISSNSDRVLVAVVRTRDTTTLRTVSGITCGSSTLVDVVTAQITVTNFISTNLRRLIAPPVGSLNCSVTLSGTPDLTGTVTWFEYEGVDQSTPVEASYSNTGASSDPATVSVTTITASSVVFAAVYSMADVPLVVGSGQSALEERGVTSGGADRIASSSKLLETAGTTTMSWTQGSAVSWTILAAALRPVSGPSIVATVTWTNQTQIAELPQTEIVFMDNNAPLVTSPNAVHVTVAPGITVYQWPGPLPTGPLQNTQVCAAVRHLYASGQSSWSPNDTVGICKQLITLPPPDADLLPIDIDDDELVLVPGSTHVRAAYDRCRIAPRPVLAPEACWPLPQVWAAERAVCPLSGRAAPGSSAALLAAQSGRPLPAVWAAK